MRLPLALLLLFLAASLAHSKLIFAFGLLRHGAFFPKNDLYDGSAYRSQRGQLTPVGMRQQFNLGSYLRRNYIDDLQLTAKQLDPNQVEFFSSSYERAEKSALSFLYGLFPLESGQRIPDEVTEDKLDPPYTPLFQENLQIEGEDLPFALASGFQPVPIYNLDEILDNCPSYEGLQAKRYLEISAALSQLQSEQAEQISRLRVMFNLTAQQTNIPTLADLYETLNADVNLGRLLPRDYSAADDRNLQYLFNQHNTFLFNGNFARVLTTPLIRMLNVKFSMAAAKQSAKKMTLIFCHQSNIIPLLTQLQLTSPDCLTQQWNNQTVTAPACVPPPAFAANLLFELHQDDTFEYFVQAKYNGEYVSLCGKLTRCGFDDFMQRIKDIKTDYEAQCMVETPLLQTS